MIWIAHQCAYIAVLRLGSWKKISMREICCCCCWMGKQKQTGHLQLICYFSATTNEQIQPQKQTQT